MIKKEGRSCETCQYLIESSMAMYAKPFWHGECGYKAPISLPVPLRERHLVRTGDWCHAWIPDLTKL